jgi:hypothetical protein
VTKRRHLTTSGEEEQLVPSQARPTKPPAKEITRHRKAALGSGGGKLPPRIRRELEQEDSAHRRLKPAQPDPHEKPASLRAGKKKPDMARYAVAVEARERRPTRKSRTPETDPGARAVPATRETSNEPKPRRHRPRGAA